MATAAAERLEKVRSILFFSLNFHALARAAPMAALFSRCTASQLGARVRVKVLQTEIVKRGPGERFHVRIACEDNRTRLERLDMTGSRTSTQQK
jgi:hypothetical protein